MGDIITDIVKENNHLRNCVYEMRGYINSTLSRNQETYERWVLESIQRYVEDAVLPIEMKTKAHQFEVRKK